MRAKPCPESRPNWGELPLATDDRAAQPAKPRGAFNRRINRPTYWLLLVGTIAVLGALAALGVHAAYL